ncbi:MAG: hypothetical protein IT324_02445 [Anaerolineae bacterium]|nr:hypothetical protein [Anaerolineae bacterium]
MKKRTVVILFFSLMIILTALPTLAGWGAGWGSGSAIGSGQVTGLQKIKGKSATVNGFVAQPGCTLPSIKKDDDHDDHHGDHHDDHDKHDKDDKDSSKSKTYNSGGSYDSSKDCTNSKQAAPSANPSQVVPGVVWCSKVGSNKIVHGNQRVNMPINFSGSSAIQVDNNGNAPFTVHVSVNQVTLNMVLNAQQVCAQKDGKDDDKDYGKGKGDDKNKDNKSQGSKSSGKGDDKDHDDKAHWLIVDFVPQKFSGALQAVYGGKVLTQAIYDCSMDWKILEKLHYKEQHPYNCTVRLNQ